MRPCLVIALVAFALAGCGASVHISLGSTETAIDLGKLRTKIAATILASHHIHTRVTCPAHPPFKKGSRFTCVAHLAVGAYPVAVNVLDNNGHVHYGNNTPLMVLDSAAVQSAIVKTILAQRHVRVTARCPSPILQGKGIDFTCTASHGAQHDLVDVTQTDGNGNVHFRAR
jgi:hypothetical protein